jgi:hypothetical protein
MSEKYQNAFEAISYITAMNPPTPFLEKLLQRKKDVLIKHLQIFTAYLMSKSNLDLVNEQMEDWLQKVSLVSVLALNYVPHSSSLYSNILTLLQKSKVSTNYIPLQVILLCIGDPLRWTAQNGGSCQGLQQAA